VRASLPLVNSLVRWGYIHSDAAVAYVVDALVVAAACGTVTKTTYPGVGKLSVSTPNISYLGPRVEKESTDIALILS
jgi:hypothetical protein